MKQHAINACGTIALFHIILNALEKYPDIVLPNSFLQQFRANAEGKDSEHKADLFKNSKDILQ